MSRKEDILKAATELFAIHGFNGTATSEIASRAGVAHGTVFHHFKSKENLLVAICDELVQDYVMGLRAAIEEGPGTGWDTLESVLRFALDFLDVRSESISVAFRETRFLKSETYKRHHPYFQKLMGQIILVLEGCLRKGVDDGSIRPVNVRETAFLLHFLIQGIHHSRIHGVLEVPEMRLEIIEFVRRSLSPDGSSGGNGAGGSGE